MKAYWVIKRGDRYMVRPDAWVMSSKVAIRFWSRAAAKAALPTRPGARVVKVVVKVKVPVGLQCWRCKQRPACDGILICKRCRKEQSDYRRDQRATRIAQGLCAKCGGYKPNDGYKMCGKCRAYYRSFMMVKRPVEGEQ
jgi:hypothetical protein